ncbi:MAG: hypothetical protein ACTHOB_01850 [Ginsengibacter sp.]
MKKIFIVYQQSLAPWQSPLRAPSCPSRLSGKKKLLSQQKKSLPASSNQEGFFDAFIFLKISNQTFLVFLSTSFSPLRAPSCLPVLVAKKLSLDGVPTRQFQTQMPLQRHCEAHKKYSSSIEKSLASWQSPLRAPSCLRALVPKKPFCASKKNTSHILRKYFFYINIHSKFVLNISCLENLPDLLHTTI